MGVFPTLLIPKVVVLNPTLPVFIGIYDWSPFQARLSGTQISSALSIGIWTPFPRRAEGGVEKDHHIRLPVMPPPSCSTIAAPSFPVFHLMLLARKSTANRRKANVR
ncbi:hypothetical protein V8C44DRAFT_336129 [Trichoderma aethiopicum]